MCQSERRRGVRRRSLPWDEVAFAFGRNLFSAFRLCVLQSLGLQPALNCNVHVLYKLYINDNVNNEGDVR